MNGMNAWDDNNNNNDYDDDANWQFNCIIAIKREAYGNVSF
jgi:hypothetical protein